MRKLKYKEFGIKFLIQNIILLIPLVLLFWFAWANVEQMNIFFWVSAALFILAVVSWMVWDRQRFKNFHCPECGMHILEPTLKARKENDPVNYYCSKCDIEWETGLIQ